MRVMEAGNGMVPWRHPCMVFENRGTVVELDDLMLGPVSTLQRCSIIANIPPYAGARVGPAWKDV